MAVHHATIGMVMVLPNGTVKPKNEMTIGEICIASVEQRILPDSTVANTSGYPTVRAYVQLEDAAGYSLRHLDQTQVITDNT